MTPSTLESVCKAVVKRCARVLVPARVRRGVSWRLGQRPATRVLYQLLMAWWPFVSTITYKGFAVACRRGNLMVEWTRDGKAWESDIADQIVTALADAPGRAFVDVGANLGLMTLNVLAVRPSTRVFAFEPSAVPYKLFARTIRANRLDDQVVCHQLALADHAGTAAFASHGPVYDAFDGFFDTGRAPHAATVTVRQETLDGWWHAAGRPPIGVIKIDTEGSELWVLSGGVELLARERPVLCLEMQSDNLRPYPHTAADTLEWLHAHGYRVELLDGTVVDAANLAEVLPGHENFMARPQPPDGRS